MEKSMNFCRRRDFILLCTVGVFLFVWVQVHSLDHESTVLGNTKPAWSLPKDKSPAKESRPMWRDDHGIMEADDGFNANSTLNFGGIVAISTRKSKRRTSLALAAELTGLHISVPDQPVWTDEDIANFKSKKHSVISKGSAMSWLGHLNAIKWFVEQGWESALIMEDDVNWDIHLRNQQVPLLARALHEVVNREVREHGDIIHPLKRPQQSLKHSSSSVKGSIEFRSKQQQPEPQPQPQQQQQQHATTQAPTTNTHRPSTFWPNIKYWDLLYVGHCGDFFPATRLPDVAHSIFPDPTMSQFAGLHADTQRFMHPLPIPAKHRFVHQSIRPLCTFGYAITRPAALRMLRDFAHEGIDGTFAYDVRILEACRDGAYKCWTANPELLHHVDDKASEITDINGGESAIPEAIPKTEAERAAIEEARPREVDKARAKARGTPNVACGIRTLIERLGAGSGVRAMVKAAMEMNGICPMPTDEVDLLKGQIFERGRTDIPV